LRKLLLFIPASRATVRNSSYPHDEKSRYHSSEKPLLALTLGWALGIGSV